MKYIGLISDTHGVFDKPVRDFLAPVDELWHAGDIGGSLEFAASLSQFKPLVAVCGNIDDRRLLDEHPLVRVFECEGFKVAMTHIGGYPGKWDSAARKLLDEVRPDIFVCGHSHILRVMNDRKRGLLLLNPGAAGTQGFQIVRTALRFRLDRGKISDMEVFELERNQQK